MESEQAQALRLSAEATYPGLKAAIEAYAANLPPAAAPAPVSEPEVVEKAVSAATTAAAQPKPVCRSSAISAGKKYIPIENFSWDQGGYNSATVSRVQHFLITRAFEAFFYPDISLCGHRRSR